MKRILEAADEFDLRQALHVAVLDALMASRRWEPGQLVFQGGTALHLAHGAPRFSEDLDFLVTSSLRLDALASSLQTRLAGTSWVPGDMQLSVRGSREARNPSTLMVTVAGLDVIGSAKVKVELWSAPDTAVRAVRAQVKQVRVPRGPAAGASAYVPTAEPTEIYADKVFALAARPRLKSRDTFDIFWLRSFAGVGADVTPDQMRTRLDTYPNAKPAEWLDSAFARRQELQQAQALVRDDLRRWLPSSWPLEPADVEAIIARSIEAIEHGIDVMREVGAEPDDGFEP